MIQRVFSVEIAPELKEEFEHKFHRIALPDTLAAEDCSSVKIYKPAKCNPDTYLMVSEWDSEQALLNKFGHNWHLAFIPDIMKPFARSHTIHHYQAWDEK